MSGAPAMAHQPAAARPAERGGWTLVQRCGGHACPPGGCGYDEARARSATAPGPALAPPIVDQALRAPGRPLEARRREDMERRLGHDFASLRVHTDALASDSA